VSNLPTCALEECNQRPEKDVKSTEWGFPRVRTLCTKHAEWAENTANFEILDDQF
jgi:hypothetical protein